MSAVPNAISVNVSSTLINKFDDLNINSKRRKLINPEKGISLNQHDIDEYKNFTEIAKNSMLNSSFRDNTSPSLDFKGGLVMHQEQLQEELCAKNDLIITTKPSTTSRGFDNTFKILENQVNKTNQYVAVMKSICKASNNIANIDAKVTLQRTNSDIDTPTRLDLELTAIERIKSIFSNKSFDVLEIKSATISTLITFLFDFTTAGTCRKGLEDTSIPLIISSISKEFPEILYHASRGTDGRQYLRVIRSFLRRQVLCGNRVSQMTRAYDDIEAVTRLLEEKEKDLELTVQIGKELLTQNNSLETKIADLETDLKSCNDDRSQLLHELHKKNELIAVLTNDTDDSENDTPTLSKSITFDLLQKKIALLQDENKSLKVEALQLASQTDDVEEQERKLMNDITMQLNEANSQYDNINLEVERQREENRLQHEQIVSLTARLAEAEMRLHQLTHDNDEHITLLTITKENQNSLALELVEFKQRYQEVLSLLQETQEQLRQQRKKVMPNARSSYISSSGLLHPDSLQSELMESSLYSENSLDSGIAGDHQRINDRIGRLSSNAMGCNGDTKLNTFGLSAGVNGLSGVSPYKKVFETVRCAGKTGIFGDSGNVSMSQIGSMSMSSASGPRMSSMPYKSGNSLQSVGGSNFHPAGSFYRNSTECHYGMDGRSISIESLSSQSDDEYPSQPSGVPGAPGAKDLEAALKRLTPAEVLARRAMLSYAPIGSYTYDENPTLIGPLGIRTPDSIMSTGSSGISSSTNMSSSINQWRLPEKLQIIKPIEGSQTLNHWSRLATPTLSGLLDERPGVTIRGGRGVEDLGIQIYTLSDVEEDISEDLPGKQFEPPGCIYTYTTSMVMHPDDGLVNDTSFLSQSQVSSRMASTSTSRQPSCPPTPKTGLSRRNSCSTFSVYLGLATMLNERGIKAVTPSALNTPAGPNFSPTVTPCNSPEGSPTRSLSPEPLFSLLSSGADLIKRKLGGGVDRSIRNQQQKQQKIMLSRLERRALRSLKLVEKVESIGLENIITSQPNAMCQLASGIANRSASPMAQLTSFKHMQNTGESNAMIDDIHFDRNQIKGLLHRGLTSPISQSIYSSDSDNNETIKKTVKRNEIEQRYSDVMNKNNDDIKITQAHNIQASTAAVQSTDSRIKQISRQKTRRNLKNGIATQRPDLGTISGNVRKDLGKVSPVKNQRLLKQSEENIKMETQNQGENTSPEPQSIAQSFVGSVSSLLFGRKGGWL